MKGAREEEEGQNGTPSFAPLSAFFLAAPQIRGRRGGDRCERGVFDGDSGAYHVA